MDRIKEATERIGKEIDPDLCTRRDFEKIAERAGVTFIGSGCTRAAFLVGDKVVKFAYRGVISDNQQESEFYSTYKETEVGSYIAKVFELADDASYIVQEYCGETLAQSLRHLPIVDRMAEAARVTRRVRDLFENLNVHPGDLHMDNISADGKVFDYAWFE